MPEQTAAETAGNDDMMTPDEVAAGCRVKRNTVYQWIREEHLPAIRLGGVLRIERSAYEAFKASGRTLPATD